MYCPNCGAEYRDNFTVCSDCQLDLVPDPPDQLTSAHARKGTLNKDEHDAFALVWSGSDPRGHAEVCDILAAENIPARTIREQDHLLYATVSAPFEVYVPSAFAAQAKEILSAANASEESLEQLAASGALEIPAEDDESPERDVPIRSVAGNAARRRYTPNDDETAAAAASIVWTGQDSEIAHMIEASLRENSIYFRTISLTLDNNDALSDGAATSISVLPEDHSRAEQIVHEITDATAPD